MSEQAERPEERRAEEESGADRKSTREKMGEGIKQGVGFLSAVKDALEETIQEARERGDLSSERAKEVVKEALDKAQAAGERARDRFDFAQQADIESLRDAFEAIRARVAKLEESVFGGSGGEAGASPKRADDAEVEGEPQRQGGEGV